MSNQPSIRSVRFLLFLILLHNVIGLPFYVNPALVTSWRGANRRAAHLFAGGVQCLVNMADGKFVTVVETCDEVRKLIEDAKKGMPP